MPEIIEQYAHSCRIVQEGEGPYRQFHYEGPMGRVKSFRNPDKARLFADVQTVTGGFREEKTGERGVPPAVAHSRNDVLYAYLVSNPSMSLRWVCRAFSLSENEVRNFVEGVRERAAEQREGEQ